MKRDKNLNKKLMLAVAVFITVAVYGFVGLIVKADNVGIHLAQDKFHPAMLIFAGVS